MIIPPYPACAMPYTIDIVAVLCHHFSIDSELGSQVIKQIIASDAWTNHPDKDKWVQWALGDGSTPSEEECKDMIDWLAPHFERYLKLKIFI